MINKIFGNVFNNLLDNAEGIIDECITTKEEKINLNTKGNPLDHQMEMVLNRVDKLEKNSHPKRNFVTCDKCNQEIKEK